MSVPKSVLNSVGQGLSFVEAIAGDIKVDILIGQDFYWKLMTADIVHFSVQVL